jgi:hypothetical protein
LLRSGIADFSFTGVTTCGDSRLGCYEDMRRSNRNGTLKPANMIIQKVDSITLTSES